MTAPLDLIMVGFWFLKAELSLLKFFAQKFVCDIGGRWQGPVSSIDHFSRVIQVYWQNICWDLRRQKGAFVSIVGEKIFDLPAPPFFAPSLSSRENARKCWTNMSLTSNPFSFNVENDRKCSKMLLKRTHKKQLLCALLGKNSLISAFSPSFTLGDSVHLVAGLVDRMNRERSNVCASVIWPIMSSPLHKTSAFQPRTI